MKKIVFFGLLFLVVSFSLSAQEQTEELSFKSGTWSDNYYIGDQKVSFKTFMEKMDSGNASAGAMFRSGKNISIVGSVVGSVGAFCFGYDLGSRISGGEENNALLVGGGGIMIGGILLHYFGNRKMKKALTFYKNDAVSLRFSPSQAGLELCINF